MNLDLLPTQQQQKVSGWSSTLWRNETLLLTGNGSPFFFRKRQAQIPIIHTTYVGRGAKGAVWISKSASPIIVPIPPQESYKMCNVVVLFETAYKTEWIMSVEILTLTSGDKSPWWVGSPQSGNVSTLTPPIHGYTHITINGNVRPVVKEIICIAA